MTQAKNSPVTKRRRKKILKQAKGNFGSKHKLFKTAKEQVIRSSAYSYAHRRKRYPFFRSKVWIVRLNATLREKYGLRYSWFIHLLTLAQIKLNRKRLSEMMIKEPSDFDVLVEKVRSYEQKIPPKAASPATPS